MRPYREGLRRAALTPYDALVAHRRGCVVGAPDVTWAMRVMAKLLTVLLFAFLLPGAAYAAQGPDERVVSALTAAREALARDGAVDVGELSKAIRAAVIEAERIEKKGDYRGALDRLRQLEKYGPLMELPSYDVHTLSAWLHSRLGDSKSAGAHTARADAMRELLQRRLGSGQTPDDPKQVVMVNDISEWARMQLARVAEVRSYPHKGRELMEVSYSGPETGNQRRIAYFELARPARAAIRAQSRLYDPLPLAELRPDDRKRVEEARQKRNRFLEDTSFPYLELVGKLGEVMKAAIALEAQGRSADALAKLKEIEAMRPIEEIPMTQVVSLYSLLVGKTGNTEKQRELRALIFGINQAIAHSGDALTPETAIEVIAIEEEYAWLRDRGLTRVRQRLLDTPAGKFDVLTAKDAAGNERDYYFNVSRMFARTAQSLRQTATKP